MSKSIYILGWFWIQSFAVKEEEEGSGGEGEQEKGQEYKWGEVISATKGDAVKIGNELQDDYK